MNRTEGQFDNNVYDLGASRIVKQRTGVSMPIKLSAPDSPSMVKHEDQAMKAGNPKSTIKSTIKKGAEAVTKYLGLDEESNS